MPKQLPLVIATVFFTQLAWAQPIYKSVNEKDQWHYSDFLSSGVAADKLGAGETPKTSDADAFGSTSRRLLAFPPSDPSLGRNRDSLDQGLNGHIS